MKTYFYDKFQKNRLDRIFSLLGKEWFEGKDILELGAAHGDIGSKLIELGSDVSFSDIRKEFLKEILKKHPHSNTNIYKIDQNLPYDLNKTFDLILHLGVLYHLENWEEDLKNALNHTNLLILESIIYPYLKDPSLVFNIESTNTSPYISFNKRYKEIDENSLIKCFNNLNVKYLRIDTPNMSTPFVFDYEKNYTRFLYGWNKDNLLQNPDWNKFEKNNKNYWTVPRQMYLILK